MEAISVFDMLKIGVGPSSSHTLGPWRAARTFVDELRTGELLPQVRTVEAHLYGSLALTGVGHGTDMALLLGLCDHDPETVPLNIVQELPAYIAANQRLHLGQSHDIAFDPRRHLVFHYEEVLPGHANGLWLCAYGPTGDLLHAATYYSVGGGFVVREGEEDVLLRDMPPFPVATARSLQNHCLNENSSIWELALTNEGAWHATQEVYKGLWRIWEVMEDCLFRGCHTGGHLPGGLNVRRRAPDLHRSLLGQVASYSNAQEWTARIRERDYRFSEVVKWIGCLAMAVNEENAGFGRVVTAPTNGAAGVIPAVLMYYRCFVDDADRSEMAVIRFLLTAGTIGSLFKQGATISAAMGGCQAEIGVSSAMAAAALAEAQGGTVGQCLMAAEIAMEHHLGLTCDPVGGLVQIPCIERNSMGAVKAITAANIALGSDPEHARVSLDAVIRTMWETAQDMHYKYKETAQGGLAIHISVGEAAC